MTGKNILLVEGTDDKHVVMHVCGHHGLPNIDKIEVKEGIDGLLRDFPVRLKESDVNAVGALVDADTDIDARWTSLKEHLVTANYPDIPSSPDPRGTIMLPPSDTILPRVGVWLMPDNSTNGILEDFLRFLVPNPNPLLDYAERSVAGIPAEHQRFAPKDNPKALIHTWLAWQEKPGKPFGTAITARYLDAGLPHAADFANWLKQLFFT